MLLEYLTHLNYISLWEIFFFTILVYNFYKLVLSRSILFTIGYFFFFILFLGIFLIFEDLDLFTIILWIIYFGLILIFIFLTISTHDSWLTSKYTSFSWGITSCGLIFWIYMAHFIVFPSQNIALQNYFQYIQYFSGEELDLLGLVFINLTAPLLILNSYILGFNCLVVVSLGVFLKSNETLKEMSLQYLLPKVNKWLIFKNQVFFSQDAENTFQTYSFLKNYKITHKIHRLQTWKRRI